VARPGLVKHPKFLRLVRLLSVSPPHAYGLLEFLWAVAYECGNPEIGDSLDVELAAGWDGESGKLTTALLKCGGEGHAGFIEPIEGEPGRFQIHDLYDHAPDYVKRRMEREATRQARGKTLSQVRSEAARKRWSDKEEDATECKRNSRASRQYANGATRARAPAPAPAPKEDSSEPAQPASEPTATVLVFPTKGQGQWPLCADTLAEFQEAFPRVDVLGEFRKARLWAINNEAKRKTPGGMLRFLQNWLERAVNKGQDGAAAPPPAGKSPKLKYK